MIQVADLSLTAEREFIASLLIDPARIPEVADLVSPTDLTQPPLRLTYQAMLKLSAANEAVDATAILSAVGNTAHAELRSLHWLLGLYHEVTSSAFLTHYAGRLRALSISRELGVKLAAVAADAKLEPLQGTAHLEAAEAVLFAITSRRDPVAVRSTSQGVDDGLARVNDTDGRSKGVKTGIYDLDRILGGLEKGALIVLGARPSIGKSTLGLVMAHKIAERGERVAFFSLEMSYEIVFDRLVSIDSGVSLTCLRDRKLSASEREKAAESVHRVGQMPILIDASPVISCMGIRGTMRRLMRKGPLAAVFVDYLQIVTPTEGSSRVEQVGTISRGLKQLAREFDVPVVTAAQLNRKTEDRDAPVLSDLRESGSIEADADVVTFIHRPKKGTGDVMEQCDFIVAKNRNGPTRTVEAYFEPSPVRFVNAAREPVQINPTRKTFDNE
jgi:replicative DNA helicase